MASVSPDSLSKDQKDELCVSYAALMLHDDGLEINVSKTKKQLVSITLNRQTIDIY